MDNSVWRSVLLDWVNSTGFLVQNYENLIDTNVNAFFNSLKQQIKSVEINAQNIDDFLKKYYKDFHLIIDGENVRTSEYPYIYSIFLHFCCVMHPDSGMQGICNNMVRKNQEMIAKFFGYIIRVNKCERIVLDAAIEEAETYDLNPASALENRYVQSIFSDTSPQTPKSKMLNNWNAENRSLKAQLETERYERENIEMQLSQCEKRLSKADEDVKKLIVDNSQLRKQIQVRVDTTATPDNESTDELERKLRKEIDDRDKELFRLTREHGEAIDGISNLKEQLAHAQSQIKDIHRKVAELHGEIEECRNDLAERQTQIEYFQNDNRELQELVKELQLSSRKSDLNSTASYDLLDTTGMSNSSFIIEENLANAVVDVRLIDQQKQNAVLNDSVQRLQDELTTLQTNIHSMCSIIGEEVADDVDASSMDGILSKFKHTYTVISANNAKLASEIEQHQTELAALKEQKVFDEQYLKENQRMIDELQKAINTLNQEAEENKQAHQELLDGQQGILTELESTKNSLAECEQKKATFEASFNSASDEIERLESEMRVAAAKHSDEVRRIQNELEEKMANEIAVLEVQLNEKSANVDVHLSKIAQMEAKYEADIGKLNEDSKSIAKERDTLQAELRKAQEMAELKEKEHRESRSEYEKKFSANSAQLVSEIEQHQRELDALKGQKVLNEQYLNEKQSEIEELKTAMETLKGEKEESKKAHQELLESKESILAELESTKTALADCEQQKATFEASCSSANDEIKRLETEISVATTKYSEEVSNIKNDLVKAMEQHQTELAALKDQKALDEQHLKDNQNMIVELQNTIDSLHRKAEESKKPHQELVDSQHATLAELQTTKTLLADCEQQKATFEASCSSANDEIKRLESEISVATTKHSDEMLRIQNEWQEKLAKEKMALDAQLNENTSMKSKLVTLEQKLSEKHSEIAQIEAKHAADIDKLNEDCKSIARDRDTFQAELEKEQELTVQKEKEHRESCAEYDEKLNASNAKLASEIEQHQTELAALKEQKALDEQHSKENQRKIEELQKTIEALKQEAEEKSQAHQELLDGKQSILAELETIKKSLADSEQNKATIKASYNSAKDEIKRLESEIANASTKHADKLSSIQNEWQDLLTTSMEQHQNELTALKDQKALDEQQLKDNQNKIAELQNTIDSMQLKEDESKKAHQELLDGKQSILAELESTKNSLADSEQMKATIEASYNSAKDEIKRLESETSDASTKHADELRRIQNECDEKVANEKAAFEVQLNEKSVSVDVHLSKVAQLEADIGKLIEECNSISQTRDTLHADLKKEQETAEQKEKEYRDARGEYEEKLQKMEEEMQKSTEISASNEKLTKEIEEHQAELTALKEQKSLDEQHSKENQSKIEELEKTIEALKQDTEEKRQAHQELLDGQQSISAELESTKKSLADCEQKKATIEASFNSATAEIKRLESDILVASAKHSDEMLLMQNEWKEKIASEKALLDVQLSESNASAHLTKIAQLEAKHKADMGKLTEEFKMIAQDRGILHAKLKKEREAAEQKEREHRETRGEYEEKLEKMKEKMKTLYKDEMAKLREKHEQQLFEEGNEKQQLLDANTSLEKRVGEYAAQMHKMNEEKLQLFKQQEIMKTRLRKYEIDSTLNINRANEARMQAKMRGASNFKMEDEEGELFDNTYLDDLTNGRMTTGRESITLDEIQRRNSMVPPHLRSSYMPQYANDAKNKTTEIGAGLDDSMLSTQSDINKRGTIYKRPGPPTPSKHGGRFSLGGTFDLPRDDREVLRESNTNNPGKVSLGGSKPGKKTPGKLRNLFTSSKVKDEENIEQSAILSLPKKIYCTSTPRRRSSRLPKVIDLDTNHSMPDVSAVGQLFTPNLAKKIFERSKRLSQKLYWSAEKRFSSDSTPEAGAPNRKSLRRKSLRRKFKSPPATGLTRYNQKRREERFKAFNLGRRISKLTMNTDRTYSIVGSEAPSTCESVSESVMEEAEIMKFHAVVNDANGIIDFDENHNSPPMVGNEFLKLCGSKRSEYSDDCVLLTNDTQMNAVSKTSDEHTHSTLTAYSVGSMDSEVRGTRQSSHCARVNWNQHKIPQLVSYKVDKPELGKSQASINSSSRQNLSVMKASFNARVFHSIDEWTKLPRYLKYYIICTTIALIAMLYMQLP